MRCHACDAPAAYAPRHRRVRVGLCEAHIRSTLAAMDRADALRDLDPEAPPA